MFANISILDLEKCKNYKEKFLDEKMICAGVNEVTTISNQILRFTVFLNSKISIKIIQMIWRHKVLDFKTNLITNFSVIVKFKMFKEDPEGRVWS